jgi:hypothetical protein
MEKLEPAHEIWCEHSTSRIAIPSKLIVIRNQGMVFNGSIVALEASGVRFKSYYPDHVTNASEGLHSYGEREEGPIPSPATS